MRWHIVTLLVCLFGVVKEFRPATPFLTPFLVSEYKNLTINDVYRNIYPFWTYSYLVALVPIFILTDLLRYKPIIILEAFGLTATWALLVWGQGVLSMQFMQISFGIASAAEIAFSSYLYTVVDSSHYKRVTSYIRTSVLIGKLFAFALAQVLISYNLGSYLLLNQISLGAVAFVSVIALFLPNPPRAKVRDPSKNDSESNRPLQRVENAEEIEVKRDVKHYFNNLISQFGIYKRNPVVFRWSLWYALLSCIMFQIYNYAQPLWIEIDPTQSNVENGLVEFINTFLGAIISFGMQYVRIEWATSGEWVMGISALCIGSVIYASCLLNHVYGAYIAYIIAVFIYHGCGTIASATIASYLPKKNYAFIFGWNTFVALLLQSTITFVAVDRNYFNLNIRHQFQLYAFLLGLIGCFFVVMKCVRSIDRPWSGRIPNSMPTSDDEN